MKRVPVVFLLVLGLVAASRAWKDYSPANSEDYSPEDSEDYSPANSEDYSPEDSEDYSPEDSEDYSSEEADDQETEIDAEYQDLRGFSDDSMKYIQDSELDDEWQDLRGFSDDSMEYLEDAGIDDKLQELRGFRDDSMEYLEDAKFDELQELRGIGDDIIEYPEDVSTFVRNRRGRGENLRSSMRKAGKSMLGKRPKTQQGDDNQDEKSLVESAVDDNLAYVTRRPLPAQDQNYPIPRTLAEQILQIMGNITIGKYGFVVPMTSMSCSSSDPALETKPYSFSQLTLKIDVIVNTECSYAKTSSINTAITTASITFSMSPESHFIISKIEAEPETDNDFQDSIGSQNNPMDSILSRSGQLIKLYLEKSVAAVFYSLKRFD